ncbi:hypothetical protein F5I97DRAFT_1969708 [Phlebopus sp. FC_14]|nr:hypothetical protein F5I97DRAFT_1969708 [Phlebopus sp. FC_14]
MLAKAVGHHATRRGTSITSRKGFRSGISRPAFHIDDTGHEKWEGDNGDQPRRTVHIRFSVVPESMPDAIRALREVERNFGRIREYRLMRDSELPSQYQAICWASFESPESLNLVPEKGTTIKVSLPPSKGKREGGPGLDDLRGLLEPSKKDVSFMGMLSQSKETRGHTRSLEVHIKPVDDDVQFRNTDRPPHRSRAMKAAIGHAFLNWGGFAPIKPLYASSPFTNPAQEPQPIDSKHMRMALHKWSQILGRPDPSFPEETEEKNVTGETLQDAVFPLAANPEAAASSAASSSQLASELKPKSGDE